MIESVNNEKIKTYAKLKMKKFRDETGLFIVEGQHLVLEAKKNSEIIEIFSTKEMDGVTLVSENVMRKLSNLSNIPSILAVVKKNKNKDIVGNCLILDGIQDPGNLGTIIRSSVAFNIDTIVASLETVDEYNDKVLRASEGMFFHVNYIKEDLELILKKMEDTHTIYTTNVTNGTPLKDIIKKEPYAIILGNEGTGVRSSISNKAKEEIYIPVNCKTESLNVAIAASIILYEFNR